MKCKAADGCFGVLFCLYPTGIVRLSLREFLARALRMLAVFCQTRLDRPHREAITDFGRLTGLEPAA